MFKTDRDNIETKKKMKKKQAAFKKLVTQEK